MKLPCSTNTHQKLEMYAALVDLEPPPSRSNPASLARAVSSALGSLLAQAISRPPTILLSEFDALIWHSCFTEPLIPRDLLPEAYDALLGLRIDVLGDCDLEDYVRLHRSELRNNFKPRATIFHSIYDGKELSSNVVTHNRPLTEEDLRVIQAAWVRPAQPAHLAPVCKPASYSGAPDERYSLFNYAGIRNYTPITGHRPILFPKRTDQWVRLMGSINQRSKRINRSIAAVEEKIKSIPDWQMNPYKLAEHVLGKELVQTLRLDKKGLSLHEIAEQLRTAPDTIRKRISRRASAKVLQRFLIAQFHYMGRWSEAEIAKALGMTETAVYGVIHRLNKGE